MRAGDTRPAPGGVVRHGECRHVAQTPDTAGLPTTLYAYDPGANLLKVLYPNGIETDYTWDPVNDRETTTNSVG